MAEESTTPDPVEIARQSFDTASRRDIDAMLSKYARDAAWDMNDAGIGTFDGVAAMRGFFEDWIGNWEDYRIETEEILDVGHEVVFVAYLEDERPVGGEGRVHQRRGCVLLIVEGLISGVTFYLDPDEARAAGERLAESRG